MVEVPLKLALLTLILVLVSCEDAPSYRMVKSPDGNHWWFDLRCEGSMADCMDNARRACKGRAYEVVESNGSGSHSGAIAGQVGRVAFAGSHTTAEMEIMVQCAPIHFDTMNDREILPPGTPPSPKGKDLDE